MENEKNSGTATQTKPIVIDRTFDLPLNTVWKAWSDPATFKKWWGPSGFTCPDCSIDFRIGGNFVASMQDKDGKKMWSTGTYTEIVPKKKLAYNDAFSDEKGNKISASDAGMPGEWPMETPVTVEFEEKNNGKTVMHLTHQGIPSEMYSDCIQGWQQCFDKMDNIKE